MDTRLLNINHLKNSKNGIDYSTAFTKVISFALHDKKFCSLARNKRGMSVGLARV